MVLQKISKFIASIENSLLLKNSLRTGQKSQKQSLLTVWYGFAFHLFCFDSLKLQKAPAKTVQKAPAAVENQNNTNGWYEKEVFSSVEKQRLSNVDLQDLLQT